MTARTLPDDFRYPPASDEQIREMQDQIAEYSAGDKSVATRIDWLGALRRLLPMYWKYRADAEYWKSWQDADKIKALETENARLLAIAQEQRAELDAVFAAIDEVDAACEDQAFGWSLRKDTARKRLQALRDKRKTGTKR